MQIDNNKPKILIVDDKTENLIILINILEPLGFELIVASNAIEVFQRLDLYNFDLILLDIIMPEVDGYEVCKNIKDNYKYADIPLIFITSLGGIEDRIKGFAYGSEDYITKPIVKDELIARVKLHLQKGMLVKALKSLLRKSYHELYNPLAVINTSLEMQTIKYGSTKYTDSITIASRGLQIIYDDLYYSLALKTHQEDIISIDLVEFVKSRITYFYYLSTSKKINIVLNASQKSEIQIRESDIQRIVDNTISNAIKYADSNSTITIDIINNDDNVIFKSKNIGSTISNPEKIFQTCYRENFEQIGMGVGLEIVSSICNMYDIETEVISKDSITIFLYKIKK